MDALLSVFCIVMLPIDRGHIYIMVNFNLSLHKPVTPGKILQMHIQIHLPKLILNLDSLLQLSEHWQAVNWSCNTITLQKTFKEHHRQTVKKQEVINMHKSNIHGTWQPETTKLPKCANDLIFGTKSNRKINLIPLWTTQHFQILGIHVTKM